MYSFSVRAGHPDTIGPTVSSKLWHKRQVGFEVSSFLPYRHHWFCAVITRSSVSPLRPLLLRHWWVWRTSMSGLSRRYEYFPYKYLDIYFFSRVFKPAAFVSNLIFFATAVGRSGYLSPWVSVTSKEFRISWLCLIIEVFVALSRLIEAFRYLSRVRSCFLVFLFNPLPSLLSETWGKGAF